MKKESVFTTRRDFLKYAGLSAGTLAMNSLMPPPALFAKGRYPGDRITFIVPYSAGGGYDVFARMISPYLSKYIRAVASAAKGGNIVIRNEPGAAGRKGRSLIMHAKPDGNTLGITDTSVITDNIVGESDIDLSQFTFLQLAASTTKVIVGTPKGFDSWSDVVNATKREPVKMAVGPFGRANHVSAIILNEKMVNKFKLINFPGTAQCVSALIRGDVHMVIASEESVYGLVEAKEAKVLMVLTAVSKYPGAISIKDFGFPELADQMSSHRFIIAPPALENEPKNILLAALKKATTDREFLELTKKNQVPVRNDIFGSDATKMFMEYKKFYENIAPMLKTHLA